MISQSELPELLEKNIPEISAEIRKGDISNTYVMMRMFFEFTRKNIIDNNVKLTQRCFALAEKLYKKGNAIVKNAVENVYVFSFSKMLHQDGERDKITALIPVSLFEVYKSQMVCSHI